MMSEVEVRIPFCTLESIQKWADKSGLGRDGFYQAALSLGVQTMQGSLGYLDYLDQDSLQEAAEALGDDEIYTFNTEQEITAMRAQVANFRLTQPQLVQIILGDRASSQEADLSIHTMTLELPEHVAKQVSELCQKSGMSPDSFYDLAFATGLRVMSQTLSPLSFFKPKTVAKTLKRRLESPSARQQDQPDE